MDDQSKSAREIENKIPSCRVVEQLNPTILIFHTRNITDNDISEHFQDITGTKPISMNKITTDLTCRLYVQLTPKQYQTTTSAHDSQLEVTSFC